MDLTFFLQQTTVVAIMLFQEVVRVFQDTVPFMDSQY